VDPVPTDPNSLIQAPTILPPLPPAVDRLVAVLDAGRFNAAVVAGILATEEKLSARLLRVVNSSYYDLPTTIKDVKHAAAYLGPVEFRRLALTVGVMEHLRPGDAEELTRFWHHAFHTALAAKRIARQAMSVAGSEDLQFSALLHDVGKLVYLEFFPQQFARLREHGRRRAVPLVDAERELGLPSHTRIGATLCERWSLPRAVRRACLSHELSDLQEMLLEDNPDDDLLLVCSSNLLSNLCTEELTEGQSAAIQLAVSQALGLEERQFLLLMGELYELQPRVHQLLWNLMRA
jgi:HD-like signal output (HDOD) protein